MSTELCRVAPDALDPSAPFSTLLYDGAEYPGVAAILGEYERAVALMDAIVAEGGGVDDVLYAELQQSVATGYSLLRAMETAAAAGICILYPDDVPVPPAETPAPTPPEPPAPLLPTPTPTPLAPPRAPPGLEFVQPILDALTAAVNALRDQLHATISPFWERVRASVGALRLSPIEAAAGGLLLVGQVLNEFRGRLATHVDVAGAFGDMVKARWPSALDPLRSLLTFALGPALNEWMSSLERELPPEVSDVASRIAAMPALPTDVADALRSLMSPTRPIGLVAAVAFAAGMVGTVALRALAPIGSRVEQGANVNVRSALLGVGETAVALRRGYIAPEAFANLLARWGLPDELQTTAVQLTEQLLTPIELLDAWRRGIISTDELDSELYRVGIPGRWRAVLHELAFVVPGAQDVIRLLVRDVFDKRIIDRFGLDDEFAQKYNKSAFDAAGVTEQTASWYWRAHWELPSTSQSFEMFHRTLTAPIDADTDAITLRDGTTVYNVLSRDALSRLLATADVLPYFRERFTQIAYQPLTRVDVRRMYRLGTFGVMGSDAALARVERAYLDLGYDQQNARFMADFTHADATKEVRDENALARASLKGRVVSAYVGGVLSEADTRSALVGMGFADALVEAFVAEAQFVRASELAESVRDGVRRFYVAGRWTEERSLEALRRAGFTDTDAERLFERWRLDRTFREASDDERAQRDLTKSELLSAYRERLLSRDDAARMLGVAGYDDRESETLLALEDARRTRAERSELRDAVHQAYVAGRVDRVTASAELDRIGTTPIQRDALLTRWESERDRREADIPLDALEKMTRAAIISREDAAVELRRRGFVDTDVERLLQYWRMREGASR